MAAMSLGPTSKVMPQDAFRWSMPLPDSPHPSAKSERSNLPDRLPSRPSQRKIKERLRSLRFGGTVRFTKKRRRDVVSVFPEQENSPDDRYDSMLSHDWKHGLQDSAILDQLGATKVQALRNIFTLCDGNDDGRLAQGEVDILLDLLGLRDKVFAHQEPPERASNRRTAVVRRTIKARLKTKRRLANGMTLDEVINRYGGVIDEFVDFPTPQFLARAKRLKTGFHKCDTSGSDSITEIEFEISLQKLDVIVTDSQLSSVFHSLDRDCDGEIEWSDLVHAIWREPPEVIAQLESINFALDRLADLPMALLPTARKVLSAEKPKKTITNLPQRLSHFLHFGQDGKRPSRPTEILAAQSQKPSCLDQLGIRALIKMSAHAIEKEKRRLKEPQRHAIDSLVSSRGVSMRTGFTRETRLEIHRIEFTAIFAGIIIGIASGLLSIGSEKWLSLIDDETDAGEAIFYMAVVSCNIIVSIIELLTVFTTALVAANGVVVCTRLILHPINAEREFLARAITRSALQIAPTQDVMFGIDPLHGAPRFAMTLWTMLYNSKRFLFRFILKLIIRTLGWQSAIVLPINAIVNAWSLRVRVLDCRKSIIGPPCAIALLERFFIHEQASIGPFQRVDYLRALGCVMVCKRCAPPNLQLMVYRMRREWLKVDLWPIGEGCTCLSGLISRCQLHPLDDIDRFMISLTLYARQQHRPSSNQALEHLKSIFFFLIVALIIDGKLEWSERRFYLRACRAAGFQQEWRAVGLLRGNFVDGKGISVQDVLSIIKPVLSHPTQRALAQVDEGDEGEELDEQEVKEPITTPLWESLVYISNRLSSALSC